MNEQAMDLGKKPYLLQALRLAFWITAQEHSLSHLYPIQIDRFFRRKWPAYTGWHAMKDFFEIKYCENACDCTAKYIEATVLSKYVSDSLESGYVVRTREVRVADPGAIRERLGLGTYAINDLHLRPMW